MDTPDLGAIRPPPAICDEREKRPKQEPESESEPEPKEELESESESDSDSDYDGPNYDWMSKREKDLHLSDFSCFDNYHLPFIYSGPRFVYMNQAHIDEERNRKKALAEYRDRSRNLSPFDAIPVPPEIIITASNFPRPINFSDDEEERICLIKLSKIALADYNSKHQGSNYEFDGLVKAARRNMPSYTYYITFKAKDVADVDPSNCNATTFQAHVWDRAHLSDDSLPSVVVKSCSIKT